jgi:hypothetical protein
MVKAASPKRIKTAKGREVKKQEFLLADDTRTTILCAVWGQMAQDNTSSHIGEPVFIMAGDMNDYNGTRSINIGIGSSMIYNPNTPNADKLREWYSSTNDNINPFANARLQTGNVSYTNFKYRLCQTCKIYTFEELHSHFWFHGKSNVLKGRWVFWSVSQILIHRLLSNV